MTLLSVFQVILYNPPPHTLPRVGPYHLVIKASYYGLSSTSSSKLRQPQK